ncbi:MAG: 50S ribosomal protein L4 [Omnitrophica WOR_2 bacterium RIFCSPHIGHO2_01_FULL_48_9]|nr:MAG: 50S ribosomal protein L4 [Omnitrophica WOR_2 bacterium RIFCSPHIGHO2_02_FULL_48_11]OGX33311.1 MAG: 50S ribosomal protein L4 [Omnitrophica WOR_2 bacterium RIFCSPHIGHO2_01_FULL_48_9]
MLKLPVYNSDGKEAETLELPESIFGAAVNKKVLHQVVLMYQANLRSGTASTKERGSVSGGGKKPWRQKGTGRARAGSNRSPLWHKGGIVFGPHPRDFSYDVPRQTKTVALRESVNAKYTEKDLLCVTDFKGKLSKTKEFAKILSTLKLEGKILALLDESDPSVMTASRNIAHFNIMRAMDVTAYDILRNKKLLVTKSAFKNLLRRILRKTK